ncbi:MAG: sulfatase [Planctomycetes bacterium]|nr:sulfatase [Planctomycetota bacterium]
MTHWKWLAVLLAWGLAMGNADARQPNVLVIVGDDMGYGDVSVHGCKDVSTPNIDSFAKNGVRCTSGYVSGPYCSPTRAGLLTSRYQTRFGHEFNPGPKDNDGQNGLSLQETTIADRFKAAGYRTGIVGKWHLGYDPKFHPLKRGFDEHYGFLGGAHPYFPNMGPDILRGTEKVDEKEYLTDAFGREAVSFIDRNKEKPFFLYLAFNAVHMPLQASDKYLKRFESLTGNRKIYCALMSAMDDNIGLVLAKLKDAKIEEDTLIFFISDNGGPAVNASNNGPLNGHKATTWEGGIRVPWMVQWKGKLPAGKVYDQPVIQLDIQPTALAAAGINPKDAKFDGVNLLPYLEGKDDKPPHESLFWRFGKQTAVRKGDWKLVEANGSDGKKLFNLKDDLGEKTDLTAKNPEKVKELQAAWDEWNKSNVAPTWGAPKAKKN